jgi:hypothetical protein
MTLFFPPTLPCQLKLPRPLLRRVPVHRKLPYVRHTLWVKGRWLGLLTSLSTASDFTFVPSKTGMQWRGHLFRLSLFPASFGSFSQSGGNKVIAVLGVSRSDWAESPVCGFQLQNSLTNNACRNEQYAV